MYSAANRKLIAGSPRPITGGSTLKTRRLGNTDIHFTTIGLGTWAIGGGDWKFGWGRQDEDSAVQAILRGVELGVNWIDTAAVYGNGRSEELVARAIAQLPAGQRPYIATKCGRIILPDSNIIGRIKRESVEAECEASLRRLGIDRIDLYQLHWPDPDEDIEEAWQTMLELKQAGKVREIGVSNHAVAQMRRLQTIHPIASLQPPYSMVARNVEAEILPYCQEHQIGVVAYSPMCKGLLTGTFTAERAAKLPADDHRSRDPKFQSPQLEINLRLVDGLRPIAQRHGRSVAELALAWVLRRSEVTSAIVGARSPRQIEELASAGDWLLSEESQQEIGQLLDERQAAMDALGPISTGRV
jgi:aryl-alcohol dehydrogenase-like predicted oxidoreductase